MKKLYKGYMAAACMLFAFLASYFACSAVMAGQEDVIYDGVYIESVDVGGMTYDEAMEIAQNMADDSAAVPVSVAIEDDVLELTLADLGYSWKNEDIVEEAVSLGKSGSAIRRYEDRLDIQNEKKEYTLNMSVDQETMQKKLNKLCKPYNVPAKNATLKATGSGFDIIPEESGMSVDCETSAGDLCSYITNEWDNESPITYTAVTKVEEPKYTTADCEKVSDTPMGTFSTSFSSGAAYEDRNLNIKNGAEKIDGTVLYPGEQYSCNDHLTPWIEDNGWHPAGTYVDGEVEDSLGGGICQVSTTLYNALLRAEIKVVERYSHSMAVSYVDLAADAALAGDYKDLVFENDTDAPIYIKGVYTGSTISFSVYGHDTRDPGHSVEYVSKTLSTTPIKTEVTKDSSKPKGYKETVSTGHTGYVAELWKVVYEDGKEESRELLHTSTYQMSPTKVMEGTGKDAAKEKETAKKTKEETTKKNASQKTDEETTKKSSDDGSKSSSGDSKKSSKKSSDD